MMEPRRTEFDEVAQPLPHDCTLNEFRYRLYLRIKADEGLAAIAAGETFTREEVAGQIKAWKEIRSNLLASQAIVDRTLGTSRQTSG